MWDVQRDALAGHDLFVPDLYGRGATIDEWAESLLAEVGERDLAAVGNSLGGYCALALARVAPERVRALVLAGARADADTPERREAREATIELVEREGPEALWREMRPQLFSASAPADMVARARRIALEQDPRHLVEAIAVMRDRPDSSELVRRFDGPLVVAVGEHDKFFPPEQARALAESAPNGRFEQFADTGHVAPLERPAEFNRVVSEALAR